MEILKSENDLGYSYFLSFALAIPMPDKRVMQGFFSEVLKLDRPIKTNADLIKLTKEIAAAHKVQSLTIIGITLLN